VNDADFKIWENYAIRAWPGLVVIDPNGYVIKTVFRRRHFENSIKQLPKRSRFSQKRRLKRTAVKVALERAKVGDLPLAFPGKFWRTKNRNGFYFRFKS
jgi:hypothetical protein